MVQVRIFTQLSKNFEILCGQLDPAYFGVIRVRMAPKMPFLASGIAKTT
jgi:hypothetical protein